jgi:hypothetical protein
LRLLLSGRDVVAGIYPQKIDGWPAQGLREPLPVGSTRADFEARFARFPFNPLEGMHASDADGFVEVRNAPTGFMLIARPVFETLAARRPDLRYTPESQEGNPAEALAHYRFFDVDSEPDNGHYLSEDFAFCKRWRATGGRVHVDTQSNLVHQGQHAFGGDLRRSLAQRGGPAR